MNGSGSDLNLIAAWLGLSLGVASGTVLGLKFHREDWLGGYGSSQRRLYRLGHISFFGLGAVNLMFYLTARTLALAGAATDWASWGFIVGAVTMPVCCGLMAHCPGCRLLFVVPVTSLLGSCLLTVREVILNLTRVV